MNFLIQGIKQYISYTLQRLKRKRTAGKIDSFIRSEMEVIHGLIPPDKIRKGTLIVKCDDIGDFMMWLHVIPALSKHAERPLIFVGNKQVQPIYEAWFDFADEVIWVDKSKWDQSEYRKDLYKTISILGVKQALSPLFTRNYQMDDLLVYASGADERVAWNRRLHAYFPGIEAADLLINKVIDSGELIKLEYFRNSEFVSRLYGIPSDNQIKPLFPDFSKQNRLIIFPVANTKSRNWKPDNYAELIRRVEGSFDQIYILGGKNAEETGNLISKSTNSVKLRNFCGSGRLIDLIPFIGESSVVVCPDTIALHIAIHTKTPVVVLSNGCNWQRFVDYAPYAPSMVKPLYPLRFVPRQDKIKTEYAGFEIQTISVNEVENAVLSIQVSLNEQMARP